jgi:hypothetical protein
MTKITKLGLLLGACLAGCGNNSSGSTIDGGGGGIDAAPTPAIEGTWVQACTQMGTATFTIASGMMTSHVASFTDAACATESLDIDLTSTYALPGPATAPAGAKKIDVTTESITFTPKAAATVAQLNAGMVCGFTDWALGTAKDVTGKNCPPLGMLPTQGTVAYNIYFVDKTATPETLQLGMLTMTEDGTTDAKRPTTLSATKLTKQ